MSDISPIEWTDSTWNPIAGCSLKSPGCANCYAMPMARRHELMMAALGRISPYAGLTRVVNGRAVWTGEMRLVEAALTLPLRWRRPRRIFVNSMSDLFHESVPDAWIDRVFAVMALCPQHTFQVLTKRADRMRAYFSDRLVSDRVGDRITAIADAARILTPHAVLAASKWPLPNVWLGVSAEDQRRADERVPDLLMTPAAVRFVSAEPLLGPIDFTALDVMCGDGEMDALHQISAAEHWRTHWAPEATGTTLEEAIEGFEDFGFSYPPSEALPPRLDWVIVGGESGNGARPMHPDWARQIRDTCAAAGVAYLFKQWGAWGELDQSAAADEAAWQGRSDFISLARTGHRIIHWPNPALGEAGMVRIGKKAAGRLLDGVEHNGFPEVRS